MIPIANTPDMHPISGRRGGLPHRPASRRRPRRGLRKQLLRPVRRARARAGGELLAGLATRTASGVNGGGGPVGKVDGEVWIRPCRARALFARELGGRGSAYASRLVAPRPGLLAKQAHALAMSVAFGEAPLPVQAPIGAAMLGVFMQVRPNLAPALGPDMDRHRPSCEQLRPHSGNFGRC